MTSIFGILISIAALACFIGSIKTLVLLMGVKGDRLYKPFFVIAVIMAIVTIMFYWNVCVYKSDYRQMFGIHTVHSIFALLANIYQVAFLVIPIILIQVAVKREESNDAKYM